MQLFQKKQSGLLFTEQLDDFNHEIIFYLLNDCVVIVGIYYVRVIQKLRIKT